MSNYLCQTAIEKTLKVFADLNSIKVQWPNKKLIPPSDEIYLRAFFIPASTDDLFLDGGHREYVGIYQIDVVGLPDTTVGPMQAIISQLEAIFYSTLRIEESGEELVITTPLNAGPLQPETRPFIPCSFNWQMDLTLT